MTRRKAGSVSSESQLASGMREKAIESCGLSAKKSGCKKSYILGGPITSKSGREKCREQIKETGEYGEDKSPKCIKGAMYKGEDGKYHVGDPQNDDCKHTGCAELKYSYDQSEAEAFENVASELPSSMEKASSRFSGFMNKQKQSVGGKKTKTRRKRRNKKTKKRKAGKKTKKRRRSRKR